VNRSLLRRVQEAEEYTLNNPVVLYMQDGSAVRLNGRGDIPTLLLGSLFKEPKTKPQQAAYALVKSSVSSRDGVIELIRALLCSPLPAKQ
jgi:hypothetical protein